MTRLAAFSLSALLALSALGCAQFFQGNAVRYANPVLDTDFPDPAVLKAKDGYYYAYGTQSFKDGKMVNIQVARSKDLVHWDYLGDALPEKPRWANQTQNTWAPHVIELGDRYVMYYSAEPNEKQGIALAVASASSPAGPFVDMGKPLQTAPGFENIDPFPFDDPETGKRLLFWGSGFKPIRVQELAADRMSFLPGSKPIEVVPAQKKPYEHLVEGAWVIHRQGWYYMFYSGDDCCGDPPRYGVSVARSRKAVGPYEKLADATGRPNSVILDLNSRWLGPGHNAVIQDAAGQDWIVYHAMDARQPRLQVGKDKWARRPLMIDPIRYKDGWPMIDTGTPSLDARPAPIVR